MAKADAGRLAQSMADAFIERHSSAGGREVRFVSIGQNLHYMNKLANMVAKSAIREVDVNANTNTEELNYRIRNRLNAFKMVIDAAINLPKMYCKKTTDYPKPAGAISRLALPVIEDEFSFKVFASCLFKPDGSMCDGLCLKEQPAQAGLFLRH